MTMYARLLIFLPLLAMMLVSLGASSYPVAAQTDSVCFAETGFCIEGRIREYWEQNGGLPIFGYPIGPQQIEYIEGIPIEAQWFERNRLELHPYNSPPYDVLLGRLGVDSLVNQGRQWEAFPASEPQSGCRFFPETQQNVCGDILAAWQASGLEFDGMPGTSEAESLALFGLPISPEVTEVIEGAEYTVQWFERARFELHPQNKPPYNVLLGLLGSEIAGSGAVVSPPLPGAPPLPVPDPLQQVQIGELVGYMYPTGLFSIMRPNTWSIEDQTTSDVVAVGFVEPNRTALIAVTVIQNPGSPIVDPNILGMVLQESIRGGFADKENLWVGDPDFLQDGNVMVPFTLDDMINGEMTTLQGYGFIREDQHLISILWAVVPINQAPALRESIFTIIQSYQIDPSAPFSL